MAGKLGDLAAFFVEPHPAAALLNIVDLHIEVWINHAQIGPHRGISASFWAPSGKLPCGASWSMSFVTIRTSSQFMNPLINALQAAVAAEYENQFDPLPAAATVADKS